MIIRGTAAKKSPLGGRAKEHDILYFVVKGSDMMVTHRALITKVIEQYRMLPHESKEFIETYSNELNLSAKQKERWHRKKCIGLYEITHIEEIEPFKYRREKNMDDWIITDDINVVRFE